METLTAQEIIELLGLKPLEGEGGYVYESYRSDIALPAGLVGGIQDERSIGTAIFYLVTAGSYSSMHKLDSDEVFHFYLGDPCEHLQLYSDGSSAAFVLGNDLKKGEKIQMLVKEGVWQGTRLAPGGKNGWALLGTTMTPAYADVGFELGDRQDLLAQYPERKEMIENLTGSIEFDY